MPAEIALFAMVKTPASLHKTENTYRRKRMNLGGISKARIGIDRKTERKPLPLGMGRFRNT
jgi:hypothetical protein